MVHLYYEWNWVAAELAFKRVLELNPDDETTHMRYALALPYFGRLMTRFERSRERAKQIRSHLYLAPT